MPPPAVQASENNELTFGVELEFLFYFRAPNVDPRNLNDGRDCVPVPWTIPADWIESDPRLPPAPVLPDGILPEVPIELIDPDPEDMAGTALGWAMGLVRKAILTVPGARVQGHTVPWDETYNSMYVYLDIDDGPTGWCVKRDASVDEVELQIDGYRCVGIEVNSPPLWDVPESHRHVYQVVQTLTSRFLLRVHPRCGFHVHVGAGGVDEARPPEPRSSSSSSWAAESAWGSPIPKPAKRHDLAVLKRAAALMWAADGVLSHAHPVERGCNRYAPSIRFASRLAHGLCARHRVRKDAFGDEHVGVMELPIPSQHDRAWLPPNQRRRLPRLEPARRFPGARADPLPVRAHEWFQRLSVGQFGADRPERGTLANPTVLSGMQPIMMCANAEQLALLLCAPRAGVRGYAHGESRLNYNLCKYLPHPRSSRAYYASGTVEFREATGSLSADWIATWSGVCLGLFRFARDASDARFWAVIRKLAAAEEAEEDPDPGRQQRGGYDVVSLLHDLGLFSEALCLEAKLRDKTKSLWYPNFLVFGERIQDVDNIERRERLYYNMLEWQRNLLERLMAQEKANKASEPSSQQQQQQRDTR
ncbi:hypothetical protein VTJ83DRAFT_2366 [Remersonia thermophila]|uniref:Amidoligase enzyme n=1 Tax=Remersonia thermophila TaxID=72144 RepID=A0ABR4DKU8_9PEZI